MMVDWLYPEGIFSFQAVHDVQNCLHDIKNKGETTHEMPEFYKPGVCYKITNTNK